MKLLVIRHGQSANNALFDAQGDFVGRTPDPALSDLGRRQADALGRAFGDGLLPRPDVLVTSLMSRAVMTAAPAADALDLPLLGHLDAYEVGGPYEGDVPVRHHDQSLRRVWPGASASVLGGLSTRLQLPDGVDETGWYRATTPELAEHAPARAAAMVEHLESLHAGQTVALVCHQEFGDQVVKAALSVPQTAFFKLANTSTSLLELDGPEQRAWWINRFDHLDPSEVSY